MAGLSVGLGLVAICCAALFAVGSLANVILWGDSRAINQIFIVGAALAEAISLAGLSLGVIALWRKEDCRDRAIARLLLNGLGVLVFGIPTVFVLFNLSFALLETVLR